MTNRAGQKADAVGVAPYPALISQLHAIPAACNLMQSYTVSNRLAGAGIMDAHEAHTHPSLTSVQLHTLGAVAAPSSSSSSVSGGLAGTSCGAVVEMAPGWYRPASWCTRPTDRSWAGGPSPWQQTQQMAPSGIVHVREGCYEADDQHGQQRDAYGFRAVVSFPDEVLRAGVESDDAGARISRCRCCGRLEDARGLGDGARGEVAQIRQDLT
eukprot:CAMPEP_0115863960 /NCGR_PEP_ID=MMETSP0287-20121206/18954_1 /TAXON_ID=412157 /ORGANISM="Chrysochromulina rotalis, Strain UIO044" /LENGTH=211 /DNA_ID=CAMNT_0003318415 /DNA_START=341 /DNA_END=974 /DNA_ORIENTATION=+